MDISTIGEKKKKPTLLTPYFSLAFAFYCLPFKVKLLEGLALLPPLLYLPLTPELSSIRHQPLLLGGYQIFRGCQVQWILTFLSLFTLFAVAS